MKKITKYILVTVIGAMGISNSLAANVSVIQDATSKIKQSHDNLLNINDNSTLTEDEKIAAEVNARKNLVLDAITLSTKEIKGLKSKLSGLPEFGDKTTEKDLKDQYLERLEAYSEYYSSQADKIKDLTSSDDIKVAAKEIGEYRDDIYGPSIESMVNFTLVFYNEDAINTANVRLTKISSEINKMEKLNLFGVSPIRTKLNKASDLIKSANIQYIKARNLAVINPVRISHEVLNPALTTRLNENSSPQQATGYSVSKEIKDSIKPITKTDGTIETRIETDENIVNGDGTQEKKPNPRDLMFASLRDIKSVYEIYAQIIADTKKLTTVTK